MGCGPISSKCWWLLMLVGIGPVVGRNPGRLWSYLENFKSTRSAWSGKGSIGVILNSGWNLTRNLVSFSADLTNNGVRLTRLWVIFRVKLTDFWVIVDPEWSLAEMDPFRVKHDPGVFRVYSSWWLLILVGSGHVVGRDPGGWWS